MVVHHTKHGSRDVEKAWNSGYILKVEPQNVLPGRGA